MYNKNWREKVGKKKLPYEYDWKISLHKEFVDFMEEIVLLAELYDWNLWGGGVGNYAVTLSQAKKNGKSISIALLATNHYSYYVSFTNQWNPNNIAKKEYKILVGSTMEETLKYMHKFLMENKYQREDKWEKYCILGGAYERYPLALKWASEEAEQTFSYQ